MKPLDIRKVGDKELLITWEDGHRSLYEYPYLRFHCGCASCTDEMTGRKTIRKENIPENIVARQMTDVGRYALKFVWSDGHQTGIYSFDMLRKLCPCDTCQKMAQ